MKKLLFLAIVTILATQTHTAYADTYTRTPSGNVTNDSFTINASATDIANWCFSMPWDPPIAEYAITLYRTTDGANYATLPLRGPWQSATNLNYSHTYTSSETRNIAYVFIDCKDTNGNISYAGTALEQGPSGATIFSMAVYTPPPPPPPPQTSIWGGSNGFWCSTTPSMIIDDMSASVADTGTNIWPLFAVVGIPIAFMIALYLVYMINNQLAPTNKGEQNDLDKPKRRRGRPRKIAP